MFSSNNIPRSDSSIIFLANIWLTRFGDRPMTARDVVAAAFSDPALMEHLIDSIPAFEQHPIADVLSRYLKFHENLFFPLDGDNDDLYRFGRAPGSYRWRLYLHKGMDKERNAQIKADAA